MPRAHIAAHASGREAPMPTHAGKAYTLAAKRADYARAYAKWTSQEEEMLKKLHSEGRSPQEISAILERNLGAVQSRLVRLGLAD